MKRLIISSVSDLQFGRHSARSFDGLAAEFVVIHGPNESGKSTLAEFLTWAIGGPWRTYANNTEAFRGGTDGKLGGRLVGALGAEPIDLKANFELLKSGTPRDKRSGYVGSTEVDAASFQKFLGGITAADYELMYRCYGANLGDIGSGGSFENLFAQFAMGGTSGVRNPREALDSLRKSAEAANKLVASLTKEIRELDKKIVEAGTNPDNVEKLRSERDQIDRRIADLDDELASVESRRSLLARVINGHEHRTDLERAVAALEEIPVVSAEWLALVDNITEIADLAERISAGSRAVENAELALRTAAASTGIDIGLLEGRSFSAPERLQITSATSGLLQARKDAAQSRNELAGLEAERTGLEAEAADLARTIGLDDAGLARLDLIDSQLPDLVNRSSRWSEDSDKALAVEAQVAGEIERRALLDDAPRSEPSVRALDPRLVVLAIIVVVGASVIHWGAAVVAGLVAAAYVLIGRTRTVSRGVHDRPTIADTSSLVNLQSRGVEFRESARSHRQLLDDGLGVLAPYVTSVDLAAKQLAQLVDLASRRRAVRDLDGRIGTLARQVEKFGSAVGDAEISVVDLLAPRGIRIELVNAEFETWLTKYEAAVLASASLAAERSSLLTSLSRFDELTAEVASEIRGLTPQAIVARVEDARSIASDRRSANEAVRDAQARFRGADLDSPEVREIMADDPDLAELDVQLEITESRAADIRKQRDELNARRGEIRVEVDHLEGTEVLPGLLLAKGVRDDARMEAASRHEALRCAVDVLSQAIDEHERSNQDPVVARASALVADIVPGWGTVIKTRDDGDKLLIQRVNADGRIGDHAISDGGRALLYLAIRLAFAQQDASRRQVALPIICDDPLIHFDDVRQEAAVRLLKKVSAEHQIVLFTCERATRDLAESLGASIVEM